MTMKSRVRISSTAVAVLFAATVHAQQDRPDIILFMVDDMGWQDTSLPFWTQRTRLNSIYETPNMERLARQGMMFTHDLSSQRPDLVRRLSRKLGKLLRSLNAQRPTEKVDGQPCPWPDEE